MTIEMIFNATDKTNLKNDLLFLYPKQYKSINKLLKKITDYDSFYIINDVIKKDSNSITLDSIYTSELHACVELLKNMSENTELIKVEDINDKELLNEFIDVYYYDCYIVIINNISYVIDLDMKNIFFSKFKTIDIKTYIRKIKLQKLL